MSYIFVEHPNVRDLRDRRSGTTLFVIHTCGSTAVIKGFPREALPGLEAGHDPNLVLAAHYARPETDGPNELIAWEEVYGAFPAIVGGLAGWDACAISKPEDAAPHAGIGARALSLYSAGLPTWTRWLYEDRDKDGSKELIEYSATRARYEHWMARWPNLQSPLDLLPGGVRNPNECSYGWEIVQPVARVGNGWKTLPFTDRQHDVAAWRVAQVMLDVGFPFEKRRAAVVGHEDLNPLARFAPYGGWDPGAICEPKWRRWRWDYFHERLDYWAGCLVP